MDTLQAHLLLRADDDGTALLTDELRLTWREFVQQAGARANAVRSLFTPGLVPHVGVLMENTAELALALGAGVLGGHVTAGINLTRRGEALRADIRTADCQVLLTDSTQRGLLAGLDLDGVRVIETDGDEWAALLAQHPGPVRTPVAVTPASTFMLIFTSGTSGTPKAVIVDHTMVTRSGSMLAARFSLSPDDVCYISMPLFHSNAIVAGFAVSVTSGAAMALARTFSASSFLPDIRRYGATYMNYVGKPLAYILQTPEGDDDADNPLRIAFGNEASERHIAEFSRRFGVFVQDGFGSTENAVIVTRPPQTPPGSIGLPLEGVAVYDRETRTECPPAVLDDDGRVTNLDDCVGELVNTTGAGFFRGYYNDPEATRQRLAGGIYWSGDLAYRDADGWVYLAGRTADWLRVDGENLATGIIEQVLMRHPAVNQVAVYGIPDPDTGDQVVAALVLNLGCTLTPAELEQFLAAQPDLSPKAWPRYAVVRDNLPTTATNKVLKRELASQGVPSAGEVWARRPRTTRYEPALTPG
jgi:fatty-acyl-CoA synthase